MWTCFWDMHSGGGSKETWSKIYIEAPQEEAMLIFQNRFGHNPNRVTCTCCGEDYSIDENEDLAQATAYHRNCKSLKSRMDENGCWLSGPDKWYYEIDESPPEGWEFNTRYYSAKDYLTLDQYLARADVLAIFESDIKDEWREGELRESGYVWVD